MLIDIANDCQMAVWFLTHQIKYLIMCFGLGRQKATAFYALYTCAAACWHKALQQFNKTAAGSWLKTKAQPQQLGDEQYIAMA